MSKKEHQKNLIPINQGKVSNEKRQQLLYDFTWLPRYVVGQVQAFFPSPNSKKNNRKNTGTGTLINGQFVITAAHVLYQKKQEKKYENFEYTICQTSQVFFFIKLQNGQQKFKAKIIPNKYYKKNLTDSQNDYALLRLQKRIQRKEQKKFNMAIHYFENQQRQDKIVTLSNMLQLYDTPNSENNYLMYRSQGKITKLRYPFIDYNINTDNGSSGAPIFYRNHNNQYYMIGIHIGQNPDKQSNFGLLFGQKIRSFLQYQLFSFCYSQPFINQVQGQYTKYKLKFINDQQFRTFRQQYFDLMRLNKQQALKILQKQCPYIYFLVTKLYQKYDLKQTLQKIKYLADMPNHSKQNIQKILEQYKQLKKKIDKTQNNNKMLKIFTAVLLFVLIIAIFKDNIKKKINNCWSQIKKCLNICFSLKN